MTESQTFEPGDEVEFTVMGDCRQRGRLIKLFPPARHGIWWIGSERDPDNPVWYRAESKLTLIRKAIGNTLG